MEVAGRGVAQAHVAFVRDELSREGRVVVRCRGGSMRPTLRDGDPVEVVAAERAEIGDAVLLEDGERLIVHRLVARLGGEHAGGWIAHCGDSHWKTVGIVPWAALLGVARLERRDAGKRRWALVAWAVGGRAFVAGRGALGALVRRGA